MAKDTNVARLRAFAVVGARARLEEIRREEAALRADFPELFRKGTAAAEAAAPAAGPARKRGRRTMSAAQKKAVSERMRKYWADRRKADKK